MSANTTKKVFAKAVKLTSENKHLPLPLKQNKPYLVLEEGLGANGQFIKINNGGREDIFHQFHFKIARL